MQKCQKHASRSIFDFFHIFTCNGCSKLNKDYSFYLGRCTIEVYYAFMCRLDRDDIENPKPFLLLEETTKDALYLMFLGDYEFSLYYDIVDIISEYYSKIIIVIL